MVNENEDFLHFENFVSSISALAHSFFLHDWTGRGYVLCRSDSTLLTFEVFGQFFAR
jgi:hypothetical protein